MAMQADGGNDESVARDGRVRRTERSRARMVEAFFDLVGEGVLQPTAQQVAERAGVGIRTVFRHFSEMDTLFAEVDAMLRERIAALLVDAPPTGDLEARAVELVARRAAIFEQLAPYMRATRIYRFRSEFLSRRYTTFVRRQRTALVDAFPEIERAPRDLADAIEWVTSFESWDRLRDDQRLSAARTVAALERAVLALVRQLSD